MKMPHSIHTYYTYNDTPLQASFYPAQNKPGDLTVIYIHGGGLVYGHRDDLPAVYRETFTNAGYNLLTIDYPLAPETKLPEMFRCLTLAVEWFLKNAATTLQLPANDYVLFGRSAGAYLAFLLAKDGLSQGPVGLISFYGYYALTEPSFSRPSAHYNQFPKAPPSYLKQTSGGQPLAAGPIETRFPLYLYGRQTGTWLSLFLEEPMDVQRYSLSQTDLSALPPVFLTASAADQDVPYLVSHAASQSIPKAVFHPVLGLPHDFDSDLTNNAGKRIYQSVIQWLERSG